ncbi:acyl transferase domain-containing protein/acyl-CoA synthetase (AMP-forming)/AMP-acid ligase II/acyl carrier protein/SAM-dependent methyltransferase [Azospirillum fermentarium]|uniref:type I polyketide synthase n=1 Tax=Azospirillum fermentarium TaxID=1233114 RepID=UPI0022263DE7|nr:type I polyketide synthase [Azospirillum fermentarium]MCW2248528.1 acyl transferase domain-containing protein/acyl-CoA synthetase (AMP-forming)/AMP-acid ligase II/acyl carrier protein/SAM-dependent methyltransferase [Azospirillum fermentarium]
MNPSFEVNGRSQAKNDGQNHLVAVPSQGDDDLTAHAGNLLNDPSVKECVVFERRKPSGETVLAAYVVVEDPRDFDAVRLRLHALAGGRIAAFVPVLHMPLTAGGAPDRAALENLPVWDDTLIPAWESAVAAHPDVEQAACLPGPREDARRFVAVDRLLRGVLPSSIDSRTAEAPAAATAAERDAEPAAPSLCRGAPLPQSADAPRTLPELLRRAPQDAAIIQIEADGTQHVGNYGTLADAARRVLGGLRRLGLGAGDKVVLQLDRNDDILKAFWGCVLGGIQPVIVSVPMAYDVESRALDHLTHIWNLLGRPLVLATASRAQAIAQTPVLGESRLAAIEDLRGGDPDTGTHAAQPDDVAFYTLSSGSTGAPKAVMLTHGNVLARARGVNLLCGHASDDVILNWLPFDHVGSISDWHIRCIALGCTLVYAPKETVLGRPLQWMELIHRYRVTHSWAPNFAYSLVSAALKNERPGDWDLSCVKGLLTAGEMITRTATREFLAGLAPFGLKPSVVRTAFGMAEMGSGVTYHCPQDGRSLTFHHIDRTSLGGTLRAADPDDDTAISFASLGAVIPGMTMRIVDDEQRVVPQGVAGHLQFSGAAVSPGYFGNTEANAVFRADGWFETGDVGFIIDGEMFLAGRAGAGIIINGANFYNSEIEGIVEQVDGVTPSFSAACAVRAAGSDDQKLAVFFHTTFTADAVLRPLLRAIQMRLTKQLGIKADYLIPVDLDTIPKTAIGKIQHKRLTTRFQNGDFQDTLDRVDALTGSERALPDRFLEAVWQRKELVNAPQPADGTCLVVLDEQGVGRRVADALAAAGIAAVTAAAGQSLPDLDGVRTVLHLSALGADGSLERAERDARALLALARSLPAERPIRLLVVSTGAESVLAGDTAAPARAVLPGVVETIARTLPALDVRHVDVTDTVDPADLVREALTPAVDARVALRDGQRWVAGLRAVDVAARADEAGWTSPFRRNGVYVLNNGLDGFGPDLAEFLLARHHARVLLLGRDAVPGDGQAAALRRLQAVGGDCVYGTGLDSLPAAWGDALDGVIHLPADGAGADDTAFADALARVETLAEQAQGRGAAVILFATTAHAVGGSPAAAAEAAFLDALAQRLAAAGVAVHGAALDAAGTADAARGLNTLLAGVRLGRGRLLIGIDEADARVRVRRTDGPLEPVTRTACFTAPRLLSPADAGLPLPVDAFGTVAPATFVQLRQPETAAAEQIELWPSVAEYYVYDDLIYYALANDERRNEKYRTALERTVKGKIAVDVGTGKEAILARLALEAGARKVYAIEKGDRAFELAVAHIESLGLSDRITVFHGEAGEVNLPEPADVCVSEIVGPIGGCEGSAVIINDAHRLLRPGGVMIPVRSTTVIAAARLPDAILNNPGFHRVPASYTEKIFDQIGYPFDLRVCIKKFPHDHLLSAPDIFEDLDYSKPITLEEDHTITLPIDKASRLDGFLVWLKLHTIEGEVIDILEHEHSWLPVYMPVFEPGVDVAAGDRVEATIHRRVCDNGLNPEFIIEGALIRANGETVPFTHASMHHAKRFQEHPFYQRLFAGDTYGRLPACRPGTPLQYLPELPITVTGAVDRERLAVLMSGGGRGDGPRQVPASEIELKIAGIWQDVLGVAEVGVDDDFFELGGHSLLLVQAHHRLVAEFGPRLSLPDLFKYPTIRALVQILTDGIEQANPSQRGADRAKARAEAAGSRSSRDIAVIGMACRFPGADTTDAFWENLAAGTESITFFSDDEVIASGIDPSVVRRAGYVKASPILSEIEGFDAEFFGYNAMDAALMDPQQRLLLECGWEALESAGYDPTNYRGEIGVYAGASMNTYLLNNVHPNRGTLDLLDNLDVTTLDSMGGFQLMVANDKDYLPTRLSYKLNLRGPSVNVQTACSTGLVVVHMACQSLLNGEADMFLAACSAVQIPHRAGHLYQDGMIVSPDGHCRAFDAQAKGTVFGSGVGVVVLKRLDDALRDNDHIVAVVKGSSVNNDGGDKVGYMAPSGEGEASAVAEALAVAGIAPETVGFIEAHGTGTEMGDPIEINALTQAFRLHTEEKGFCAIASVKTNVGHLQITSGMAGFIKAALALEHKAIPANLHFDTPNPAIDFENSPFYVPTTLTPWPATGGTPRRAGVNSLGIGGTNAHVILEEAPQPAVIEAGAERPRHILTLSARNETALAQLAGRYAAFLGANPDAALADVCFTANTGRKAFNHRVAVAAGSVAELASALGTVADGGTDADGIVRGQADAQERDRIAFLFTGQGAQYVGMGRELYETQPVFRAHLDRCAAILDPLLGRSLTAILYPAGGASPDVDLDDTLYAQPALFAVEYALAQLWQSWGIVPDAVMGHSLGEYVAACIAGVFSLEDALTLVAARARLMQALPRDGEMMAVFAGLDDIRPLLDPVAGRVAVAAENGPAHTVLSGAADAIATIRAELERRGIGTRTLRTSHAFHSPLMEPMLGDFAQAAARVTYAEPSITLVSNVTGAPATDEVATAAYWCRHIRQPVLFRAGVEALVDAGCDTFVEIGPKPTLLGLASGCVDADAALWLPSLAEHRGNWDQLLDSLARLAVRGPVDWAGFDAPYTRRRLPLPTYPFQRQRYWLDRPAQSGRPAQRRTGSPLLGQRLRLPALGATVYENRFSVTDLPLLGDHRIFGEVVVSGACYLSMLLAAVAKARKSPACVVRDVGFVQPLVIAAGQAVTVQAVLTPEGDRTALRLVSFADDDGDDDPVVSTHVEAVVHTGELPPAAASVQPRHAVWERCAEEIGAERFYRTQAERHIGLGPSYRWIDAIRLGKDEAVCAIRVPAALGGLESRPLHPGLLDAAFGLLLAAAPLADGDTWLPFGIEAVRVHADPDPDHCWAHLVLRPAGGEDRVAADVQVFDRNDRLVLEFIGFEGRRARSRDVLRHLTAGTEGRLYAKDWRPLAPAAAASAPPSRWLLLADNQGVAESLARPLQADGARCVLAFAGTAFAATGDGTYRLNPAQPQDFDRLLRDSLDPGEQYDGVIHLWGLDEPADDAACAGALHLVQALDKAGALGAARVWLVTRGAQAVAGDAEPVRAGQAPLWGLGLTLGLEYPQTRCTCVDLDPAAAQPADDLLSTLRTSDDEGEVAWRRGMRHVARLTGHRTAAGQPVTVRADGGYLITGGLGALGLLTAEWLVNEGARHLVLVGRRPPSADAAAAIARLEQAGATVRTVLADAADAGALATAIGEFGHGAPALRGVIHAAGGIADGMMADQGWERFRSILPAKTAGAWNLHTLTRGLDLDFFALFSSAASLLGNPGQANYAAANAYLDALAHHRRAQGLTAVSINWGPWEQVGIATSDPTIRERLGRQGFTGIQPGDGIALLSRILGGDAVQVGVMDADWATYLAQLPKAQSLFLDLGGSARRAGAGAAADAGSDLIIRLHQGSAEQRRGILDDLVRTTLQRILGIPAAALDGTRPLTDQGLDSLMAVQLRNGLANALQRPLPVTLVFNYPTVGDIAGFLEAQLPGAAGDAAAGSREDQPQDGAAHRAALDLLTDIDDLLAEDVP